HRHPHRTGLSERTGPPAPGRGGHPGRGPFAVRPPRPLPVEGGAGGHRRGGSTNARGRRADRRDAPPPGQVRRARAQGGEPVKREDLLKMLDLSGTETTPPARDADELSLTPSTPPVPSSPPSQTALVLDAWGLRRGEELLAGTERVKGLDANAVADFH